MRLTRLFARGVPLLAIYSREKHPMVPATHGQALAELAPSAHMVWLNHASHFAHVDRPEAVTTELIDFLTAPRHSPVELTDWMYESSSTTTHCRCLFGAGPTVGETSSPTINFGPLVIHQFLGSRPSSPRPTTNSAESNDRPITL